MKKSQSVEKKKAFGSNLSILQAVLVCVKKMWCLGTWLIGGPVRAVLVVEFDDPSGLFHTQ